MLAQNLKTAAELDISEERRVALVGVLGMLERDEIRHAPNVVRSLVYGRKPRAKTCLFNMYDIYTRTDCGTAACIAGAADFFFNSDFTGDDGLKSLPRPLITLFCPDTNSSREWSKITADQAARAVRSYLTTGEANWAEALAAS